MDMRGHGRSEGRTAFIPSVRTIAGDMTAHHRAVINVHRMRGQIPPIYCFSHSLGSLMMMHAQLRRDEEPVPYTAVTLINPCFGMYNKKSAKAAANVMRGIACVNPQASTPEMKVNPDNVPDHSKPWVFDFENRFQRKIVPARTVVSLQDEMDRHGELIGLAATDEGGLSTAMCCGHARPENAYEDIETPM